MNESKKAVAHAGAPAKGDPELKKATEALEAERKTNASHLAALARLESNEDLDPNASDADIEKHLTRTAVARTRVGGSYSDTCWRRVANPGARSLAVMAGLDPAIHALPSQ